MLCRQNKRTQEYLKLSIEVRCNCVLSQMVCSIKISIARTRHDTIYFQPIVERTSEIFRLYVVAVDKAYDGEVNHIHL